MTSFLLGAACGIAVMLLKDAPWAKWRELVASKLKKPGA